MFKRLKEMKRITWVLTAVLVVTLSLAAVALAEIYISGGQNTINEGNKIEINEDTLDSIFERLTELEGASFGGLIPTGGICDPDGSDPVTTMCNVSILETDTESTSTWEISEDGFVKRISLPTATTSVRQIDSQEMTTAFIHNTWGRSICHDLNLFVDDNDYDAFRWRVGTSTPTTTNPWAASSTAGLFALTEVATDTEAIIETEKDWGSSYRTSNLGGSTVLSPTATNRWWIWESGDLVGLSATSNNMLVSSTAWLANSGFLDIPCRLMTTETSE